MSSLVVKQDMLGLYRRSIPLVGLPCGSTCAKQNWISMSAAMGFQMAGVLEVSGFCRRKSRLSALMSAWICALVGFCALLA